MSEDIIVKFPGTEDPGTQRLYRQSSDDIIEFNEIQPRIEVLIPTTNGIMDTIQAVESFRVAANFADAKVTYTIIDGGSTDGTIEWAKAQIDCKVIEQDVFHSFGRSINLGLRALDEDTQWVVIGNNDVVVYDFAFVDFLFLFRNTVKDRIGALGPVSNMAGGRQITRLDPSLDTTAQIHQRRVENNGRIVPSGFLTFFFFFAKREMIDEVGEVAEIQPGGFEDIAYCHEMFLKEWELGIAPQVFVHHKGSATFHRQFPEYSTLMPRLPFYRNYAKDKNERVCAIIGVDSGDKTLYKDAIKNAAETFDGVRVIYFSDMPHLKRSSQWDYPVSNMTWDAKDKSRGWQKAVEKAREEGYDWVFFLNGSEFWQGRKADLVRLIRCPNPIVEGFAFPIQMVWGSNTIRIDDPFMDLMQIRLCHVTDQFKVSPPMEGGTAFITNPAPWYPPEMAKPTFLPITTLRFMESANRESWIPLNPKFDPQYPAITCQPARSNRLSFALMYREEDQKHVVECIETMWHYAANIYVLAYEKDDFSRDLEELYGVRMFYSDEDDLATRRNYLLKQIEEPWVFFLDPDERPQNPQHLWKLVNGRATAYLFIFRNYQRQGRYTVSKNIRLFRTDQEYEFSGKKHETIERSIPDNVVVQTSPHHIDHYGWMTQDLEETNRKIEEYTRAMEEELEENPTDPKAHFSLAIHFFEVGDEAKAEEFLLKAMQLNPKFLEAQKELGFHFLKKGRRLLAGILPHMLPTNPLADTVREAVEAVGPFANERMGLITEEPRTPMPEELPSKP